MNDPCELLGCFGHEVFPLVPHTHEYTYHLEHRGWWITAVAGAQERYQLPLPGFRD